jgi:hypothetical protein
MGGLQYWIKPSSHDILSAWYLVGGGGYSFLMIGTFAVLFLGLVYRWQKAFAILPTTILFLPWATILAINYLIKPIFIDRLFEWMAPTVLGLAATGIVFGLKQSSSRLIVTLAVVSFCLYSSYSYYVTPTENWRGVVKTIFAEMQPGDVIVASPNEITVPLIYYVSDEKALSDILFVPSPFPALNLDRPYIAGLGAPKIIPSDGALVTDAIRMHPRVWLIERRSDIYDPEEVVRSAISASHKLRKAFSSADIMVTLFE